MANVDAMDRGQAELVTTFPAKLAVLVHGLAPGLAQRVLAFYEKEFPAAVAKVKTLPAEKLAKMIQAFASAAP